MKIKSVIIFAFAICFMACENQLIETQDFGSTAVYFPFQTPVRTIIQGDYDLGFNDNDNNGKFEIGVRMSGVFENQTDRKVNFELAPELINATALGVDTVNVKMLPASYYTIEQASPVTIPSGATNGRIPIQLNDAFFDDPLSYAEFGNVHYVIPLKITSFEGLDSLLTGIPIVANPIKIKLEDWNPAPKDYTLFGIKFMNKYHGVHLRRGQDKVLGTTELLTVASGNRDITNIDTTSVYHAEFIVQDEVTPVTTSGRSKVKVTNRVRRGKIASSADVSIDMDVNASGDITISAAKGETRTVTGSGRWVEDGDEWGGKKRNVFYIKYQYRDRDTVRISRRGRLVSEEYIDLLHEVTDTLVMRNRDVKFEEFIVDFNKQ